jgi:hypothetical protein
MLEALPRSTTRGRAMPWWQGDPPNMDGPCRGDKGTHLTWIDEYTDTWYDSILFALLHYICRSSGHDQVQTVSYTLGSGDLLRTKLVTDYSLPSTADVKKTWINTPFSLYAFIMQCLVIKCKGNFTWRHYEITRQNESTFTKCRNIIHM